MDELIRINYDSERPTVSGRELHDALGIGTKYTMWFDRMCDYGFTEGTDYEAISQKWETAQGNVTTQSDHLLSIDMAKQLCMIQRTDIGRKFRQYFIKVEEAWNSPEAVMARALQFANQQLALLTHQNEVLTEKVAVQGQQILEMKPKVSYYDVVLNCRDLISTSAIAKDYGKSAIWMNRYLHEKRVQFKQGDIWLLYQKYAEKGYTSTKTHTYPGNDGENHTKVHTYWTQKGRLFIYELMTSDGMYPLIEQEV